MKARGIKKFGENHFIDEGFPGNIGKTGSDQYKNRMYFLENNGYQNVTVLKKAFAIEVEDYDGKETLLHEISKDGDIIAMMSKTGDKYILKAKSVLAKGFGMLVAFNGCGFNCRRFKKRPRILENRRRQDDEKFYGWKMKTEASIL